MTPAEKQKQEYKELRKLFPNVSFVTLREPCSDFNGCTIAYEPAIQSPDCKMLVVSVSYCSEDDEFKKKAGKYEALKKMYVGEYVQIPLGAAYMWGGKAEVEAILTEMFWI